MSKNQTNNIKEEFYVEVIDDRVDLDPPYVWQSCAYENKKDAQRLARKVAASFNRSDLSYLSKSNTEITDYLNPNWPWEAKGIKKHLHVDVMVMIWYCPDGYDIDIEENIK